MTEEEQKCPNQTHYASESDALADIKRIKKRPSNWVVNSCVRCQSFHIRRKGNPLRGVLMPFSTGKSS